MNYTSHVFSPPDALSLHDTYSKTRNIFPPKNNGQKNCLWENTSNLNSVIDGFDIWAAKTKKGTKKVEYKGTHSEIRF